MHTYKIFPVLALLAGSVFFTNTYCAAEQDPEAAARQAQVDADMAESNIQDIRSAQAGEDVAEDIDTQQGLADDAKVRIQQKKLWNAEAREEAADREMEAEGDE